MSEASVLERPSTTPRTSARQRIIELAEPYGGYPLPWGVQSEIAREVGVSSSWVNTVLSKQSAGVRRSQAEMLKVEADIEDELKAAAEDGYVPAHLPSELARRHNVRRSRVDWIAARAGLRLADSEGRRVKNATCPECGDTFALSPDQERKARANLSSGLVGQTLDSYVPTCSSSCAIRRGIRLARLKGEDVIHVN